MIAAKKKSKIINTILEIAMICLGLFPLLPNKLKPLPIVIFLLAAMLNIIWKANEQHQRNNKNLSIWIPVVLSATLILYAVSLVYSEDLKTGFNRLETGASLLLAPWIFYFLWNRKSVIIAQYRTMAILYFLSAVAYSMIIIAFFWYNGYYHHLNDLQYNMAYLDGMLPGYSQHAIYASIILSIAFFLIPFFWYSCRFYLYKILIAVGCAILAYIILLLFRKGVVIALVLSLITVVFFKFKRIKLKYILLIVTCTLLMGFYLSETITYRIKELVNPATYEQVDVGNSTSVRFAIYSCALTLIKEQPFIGYGVGDGYKVIAGCLKEKYNIEFTHSKHKKNTHNQYLGIVIYTGFIGLMLLFAQLFLYFKSSIGSGSAILFQLLIFFVLMMLTENILDRQTGVLIYALFLNLFFFCSSNKEQNKVALI